MWLWKIYRKQAKAQHGWQQDKPQAWVVRVPAKFIDHNKQISQGSFQTVVMASSEIMAWETAMDCDIWEKLPFEIKYAQVFPREIFTCVSDHVETT